MNNNKSFLVLFLFLFFGIHTSYSQIELVPFAHYNKSSTNNSNRQARLTFSSDTMSLPFHEEFTDSILGDLWQENIGAYLNDEFGINPPSFGVLSFDGIDGTGTPYDFVEGSTTANIELDGIGDRITSAPIDLSSFTLNDRIALSFFYQLGTAFTNSVTPDLENGDVLTVFFRDREGDLVDVWPNNEQLNRAIAAGPLQDTFHLEFIPLTEEFLHAGFQFTFELTQTRTTGGFDLFSLDQIDLDTAKFTINGADTTFIEPNEFAFSTAPNSLLNGYTSIPISHFVNTDASIINETVMASLYSLDDSRFVNDRDSSIYIRELTTGTDLFSSQSSSFNSAFLPKGSPLFIDWDLDQTTIKEEIDNLAFDEELEISTRVFINTPLGDIKTNDSVSTITRLSDFYAYDDGTAETGFGIRTSGNIVQAFDFLESDIIRGLFIHYPQIGFDLSGVSINYRIYSSLAGIDGASETELVFSQSGVIEFAEDSIVLNEFLYVPFNTPLDVTTGRYYIGISQNSSFRILIGFDLANNNTENIYSDQNDDIWESAAISGFHGSLMIRPAISSVIIGTDDLLEEKQLGFYPNPSKGTITVDPAVSSIVIRSINGVILQEQEVDALTVHLNSLHSGIYIIDLYTESGKVTRKLTIE